MTYLWFGLWYPHCEQCVQYMLMQTIVAAEIDITYCACTVYPLRIRPIWRLCFCIRSLGRAFANISATWSSVGMSFTRIIPSAACFRCRSRIWRVRPVNIVLFAWSFAFKLSPHSWTGNYSFKCKPSNRFWRIGRPLLSWLVAAKYSASVVEREIGLCRLLFHRMAFPAYIKVYPKVDLLFSSLFAHEASKNPYQAVLYRGDYHFCTNCYTVEHVLLPERVPHLGMKQTELVCSPQMRYLVVYSSWGIRGSQPLLGTAF